MDLGIAEKNAIVCASSRGLGKACARALANEGVNVWISARTEDVLLAAADEIRATATGRVRTVCADVTTDEGRDALYAACPAPDILVNNAGGPPPGDFRDWAQEDWLEAVNANMYSAIDMIRRGIDGMIERRFGRIVNVTSVAVKMPIGELGLSNGARAGLTGFIAGLARDKALKQVTVNNLLPGYVATKRLQTLMQGRAAAAHQDFDEFSAAFFAQVPLGRPGDPDEFGAVCAFLCSRHAAYMTGQNILMDGGLYPGTL